jgi:hypothetical protein
MRESYSMATSGQGPGVSGPSPNPRRRPNRTETTQVHSCGLQGMLIWCPGDLEWPLASGVPGRVVS